ncbi:MAG: alpha/beta hydrolase [Myxococcales bacterium]|nr:alpha/beta hydrolase [Myxococcales bacterium]MCB9715025.1 alpha/beta hydrolase [Myxococcales bacterium]
MRRIGVLVGVCGAWLGLGCGGDDGAPAAESGSSGGQDATTVPLPTAGETGQPGTTEGDPDTTAAETGMPGDLPPMGVGDCEQLEMLVAELPDADAAMREAMVEQFVRDQSYGEHGLPGVEGSTLCVAHLGVPGDELSVAGDFNEWVADEHPLVEPVPGLGFSYAIVELPAPPQGLYKLVRGGEEFFADPLARRFGWDEFGEYSQIDAVPDRSHHERWPGFDQGAGALEPRTVTVYLPAGALGEAELPVLYMHDGQNLFSPDAFFGGWRVSETLDVAIGDGTLAPMVVVGIDNTPARFEEYTPVTDVIDGMNVVGGQADEYADFLVDGIKPFVEARYPVSADPSRVGVMGSSLGGLVSLYIGLRHRGVFDQVASMSGTIDWGTFGLDNPTIDELYLDDPPLGLRVYVDSGGSEGTGCPDGDSDNYCGNVRFADALRGQGWVDGDDLFYAWDPGAPHNEAAWASRLLVALVEWFPQ